MLSLNIFFLGQSGSYFKSRVRCSQNFRVGGGAGCRERRWCGTCGLCWDVFLSFLSPPKIYGPCLTLFHQELLSPGHADAPLHVFNCLDAIYCPGGRPGTCFGGRVGPACSGCPPGTYWSALKSYKSVTCFHLF